MTAARQAGLASTATDAPGKGRSKGASKRELPAGVPPRLPGATAMTVFGGALLAGAIAATGVTATNTWRPCEQRTTVPSGAADQTETVTTCAPLAATDGFPLLAAVVGGVLLLPELVWRLRPFVLTTPAGGLDAPAVLPPTGLAESLDEALPDDERRNDASLPGA